jgi:hypothetical protein
MAEKEGIHLKKWIHTMEMGGAIAHRIPDYMVGPALSLKKPFDYFLFFGDGNNCITVPVEGKFQNAGKTFSLKRWREGPQGHQFRNLLKYKCCGAYPVLVILWKVTGRVLPKVIPITVDHQYLEAIELESHPNTCDLIALKNLLKIGAQI